MADEEDRNVHLARELHQLLNSYDPPVGELHCIFSTAGMYIGKVAWRGDSRLHDVEIAAE